MECLFCSIINGEIKADKVYEDELSIGIRDINPQAPVHVLIIPKKHISTLNEITEENKKLIGHLFFVAKEIAKKEGLAERGYRTVINCNREAGQTIFHIHLHLLGGRLMGWPPG
jgi:histidine triad (HIT) family protein